MTEEKIIKSRKSSPDTKYWYEFFWREQQETPNRIEDAAKFLASMISISLSIFLAVGKAAFEKSSNNFLLQLALVCWILALISSFFVLFPWPYHYISESLNSMKKIHRRVVRDKYIILIMATILFLFALSALTYLFFFCQ